MLCMQYRRLSDCVIDGTRCYSWLFLERWSSSCGTTVVLAVPSASVQSVYRLYVSSNYCGNCSCTRRWTSLGGDVQRIRFRMCSVWTYSTVVHLIFACSLAQVCLWMAGSCHQRFWNHQQLQQCEHTIVNPIDQTHEARWGLEVHDVASITGLSFFRSEFDCPDSSVAVSECGLARDIAWRTIPVAKLTNA